MNIGLSSPTLFKSWSLSNLRDEFKADLLTLSTIILSLLTLRAQIVGVGWVAHVITDYCVRPSPNLHESNYFIFLLLKTKDE